ncbi:MAG: hypothetical protein ABI548_22225 [Polyangiaceae bacterium]
MSADLNAALNQARRASASGRALFREGLIPECHSHMVTAQHALIEAWREREPRVAESAESATDPQEQALAALARAGYRRLSRLRAALAATADLNRASLPVDAASLDPQLIWAEVERLTRFSERSFTPPQVRWRTRWRWAAAAVLAGLIALLFVERLRARPHAHASAEYSDDYAAVNTTDGLGATEWLLPSDTLGWLDITLPSARAVHRVRLFNAHNVFYLDRATRDVHVTAFSEKGPVASATGGFKQLDPDQSILDLPLEANDVTRVRIEVLSYFKRGAGLADVEVH